MNRRMNGFGSLINKGEGKPWLARWVYKGQVHYKSTGEPDKKKALKVLERITRPFREQREIDVLRSLELKIKSLQECMSKTALPLDSIWSEFAKKLKHEDVEAGTSKVYESAVNQLVKWMKPKVKVAKDINAHLAEEYLEELASSIGATTYNIRLVLFKRIWKSLKDEFDLVDDAWESFKLECWTLDITTPEENLSGDYFDKELRKLFPLEVRQKLDEQHSCIYDFCKRYKCFCDEQIASEATCYSTIRTFIGPDGNVLYENDNDEDKEPSWEDLVAENYAKICISNVLDGRS